VDEHWPAIERVAAALIERGELTGNDIDRLIALAAVRSSKRQCND
jgi:hypothetical protein